MTMKIASLLAAALLAGTCSFALAQGSGGGAGSAGSGAGADIATPKANPGPGGTAGQSGGMKSKAVHYKKKKKKVRRMN
jgi:hypothetical protein